MGCTIPGNLIDCSQTVRKTHNAGNPQKVGTVYTIALLDASYGLQYQYSMKVGESLGTTMALTLEQFDMHMRDGDIDGPEVSPHTAAANFDRMVGSWEVFSNDDDDYPMGVMIVQRHHPDYISQ